MRPEPVVLRPIAYRLRAAGEREDEPGRLVLLQHRLQRRQFRQVVWIAFEHARRREGLAVLTFGVRTDPQHPRDRPEARMAARRRVLTMRSARRPFLRAARRQAVAVADALRVENSELRTERDGLRARCGALESGSMQVEADALAYATQRLTAELAAARQHGERLMAAAPETGDRPRFAKNEGCDGAELPAANADAMESGDG